jgi:hypothetical protein
MSIPPISSTAVSKMNKSVHLTNPSKLRSLKIPVTDKTAVSLARRRIEKQVGSNTIVNFPHSDIHLKSKVEALLKKALQEATKGFRDRYSMEKAQDQMARIVKMMNGLKTYEEGASPAEFSPQTILKKGLFPLLA